MSGKIWLESMLACGLSGRPIVLWGLIWGFAVLMCFACQVHIKTQCQSCLERKIMIFARFWSVWGSNRNQLEVMLNTHFGVDQKYHGREWVSVHVVNWRWNALFSLHVQYVQFNFFCMGFQIRRMAFSQVSITSFIFFWLIRQCELIEAVQMFLLLKNLCFL